MTLAAIIARSLDRPVPPEIRGLASHLLAGRSGVAAILAYGSCLRGVPTTESLVDLYVLTDDLGGVSDHLLSRLACRLVPPNVYYVECEIDGQRYRAKYAVLPLALFARWMKRDNPYFWARFSQPAALVFAAGDKARQMTVEAIARAATAMFAAARGRSAATDVLAQWTDGFAATYATELRAETAQRAGAIVAANADYYREISAALADASAAPANWRARRLRGKLWSVARLTKAAFTFTGGAEYIAWKIERHTGHRIELSAWQMRHPVLAGFTLLPRLLRRGAIR